MLLAKIVLLIGLFSSCITARLVLLAGRAEINLLSRNERGAMPVLLTLISGVAFIGILIVGFFMFAWWVWIAAIAGFNILATLGTQSDNFYAGLAAMPIFDSVSIISFIWSLVSLA